jgi:hypothetical protein
MRLDAGTFLLQWATGGLAFTWFTTRRRLVGLGYGWLMRGVYLLIAVGALVCAVAFGSNLVFRIAAAGVASTALAALGVSIALRRAGVSGQQSEHDRRTARVAAMTGIDRGAMIAAAAPTNRHRREFPPALDLIAPAIGIIGLVAAGVDAGGSSWLAVARLLAGAAFLGAITDAMLLGHWYLVQPGLPRSLLLELVRAAIYTWPVEVALLLVRPGMIQVLTGSIDDGWDGTLGWFWLACAIATLVLLFVTRAALAEREYSAVMAATGLLYLAILTAFGTDLVARAVLAA